MTAPASARSIQRARLMAVELSAIPTAALYAELQRRGWNPGRPATVTTCPRCGKLVTARELRRKCPGHLERMER